MSQTATIKSLAHAILKDYARARQAEGPRQSVLPPARLEMIRRAAQADNAELSREFCDRRLRFGAPPNFEFVGLHSIPAEAILEVADYVFKRYHLHMELS